jgi:hypothetical protein
VGDSRERPMSLHSQPRPEPLKKVLCTNRNTPHTFFQNSIQTFDHSQCNTDGRFCHGVSAWQGLPIMRAPTHGMGSTKTSKVGLTKGILNCASNPTAADGHARSQPLWRPRERHFFILSSEIRHRTSEERANLRQGDASHPRRQIRQSNGNKAFIAGLSAHTKCQTA